MIIAGMDPGKTGALSIVYPDGAVLLFDVPRIKLKGKDRPAWLDWAEIWGNALEFNAPDIVVIEEVASRPNQSSQSGFTFGRTLGYGHGILASRTKASFHFVTPAVWKGKLGLLNSDKAASREKARNLYPRAAHAFARVKDDGRAEATLLAHYGRKYLSL